MKELPHDFFAECPQCNGKSDAEQKACDFCEGMGYWTVKSAKDLITLVHLEKKVSKMQPEEAAAKAGLK